MNASRENAPEWLDRKFLENAMRIYRRDDTIEIFDFTVNNSFGGHFASSMFQSEISFRSLKHKILVSETINVVIKAKPLPGGLNSEVVAGGPLFETEIKMYKETLPAMQNLFERNGIKIELAPE